MRIRFATAWCTATLAGLAVSWWGVQHAVGGTALGDAPVAAVPVRTGRPPAPPDAPASAPATRETLSPAPSRTAASRSATAAAGRSAAPSGGRTRTFALKSGRVVLEVREHGARLVSASPEQGFEVREWRQVEWLRVDLTDGEHGSAVFATWNGHPTLVQVYEY
ncbi:MULTISPECIES: hypothetical protein [Actinomadura]|uniref:hypothetical protein n=1 Tax=Actinomadura TaxID=1988 RepID=UPI00040F9CBC|nr:MULTISPECIES: hypothetical protein [Actinomadura]